MRFLHVTAEAFGPFVGEQLELAPGMTFVWGPNESGKSTWHAALYAALCGMRRARGAPRRAEREFAARHQPWDAPHWRVQAVVELADGRRLELRRDLVNQVDCSILDAVLGTDVSDEYMQDGSPDGAVLFGLTRETLLPTVCVRQAEVLAILEQPENLQEALQRAAATGGADDTAAAALTRLRAFRREHVGTDRRNSTKPLRTALDAVERARADLEHATAAHEQYLALARRRDDARRTAEEAVEELRRARATLAARRLARLEQRYGEITELSHQFPDGPPPPPTEDDALAEKVGHALAAWEARPDEPVLPEGPSAAELEDALAALPASPEGDTDVAEEVSAALAAWRRAADALAVVQDEAHGVGGSTADAPAVPAEATPGALRALADALETPIPQVDPDAEASEAASSRGAGPDRTLLAVAAIASIVGLTLLAAGQVVAGAVLLAGGVAAGVAAFLRRGGPTGSDPRTQARLAMQRAAVAQATQRRDEARRQAEGWGLSPEPDAIRRLARTVEDRAHAAEEQSRREAEMAHRHAAAGEAAGRLRSLLAARGVDVGEDLKAAYAAYEAACRARRKQAAEAARADDLRALLRGRQELEQVAAAQRRRREEAAQAVVEAARTIGVASDGERVDDLVTALQRWQSERAAGRAAALEAHDRWSRLEALLDGASTEQVEAELRRCRDEHAAFDDVMPLPLPEDADEAGARVRALEEQAHEADLAVAGLEAQLVDREGQTPSVAEAEERLAHAKEEVARVRRLDATLTRTVEFLEEARDRVHRDIAPRLKRSVEAWLPAITGNRYAEAAVNPADLQVQVRAAGGTWRDAVRLSQGTAEQIYLLLRVAMAEHLVTTGEPVPLLLDDPTVQADRQRTEAILDLLHELSADRQIIVFSQEDEGRSWAQAHLTGTNDALIQLDPARIPA